MERDFSGELESWLQEKFAELCLASGHPVPLSGLRIHPPLGKDEARYFLLGLEEGLFRPDEEGGSPLFQPESLPPRLFREGVCQLATVSSLILKRGWLPRQILTGGNLPEYFSRDYGVSALVRQADDKVLFSLVVKRSAPELQKLVADLRACFRRGAHSMDDCGFPQNHPKYEFCAAYKPAYFWAVAPDADVCLRVTETGAGIELEELPTLPPRSLLE